MEYRFVKVEEHDRVAEEGFEYSTAGGWVPIPTEWLGRRLSRFLSIGHLEKQLVRRPSEYVFLRPENTDMIIQDHWECSNDGENWKPVEGDHVGQPVGEVFSTFALNNKRVRRLQCATVERKSRYSARKLNEGDRLMVFFGKPAAQWSCERQWPGEGDHDEI